MATYTYKCPKCDHQFDKTMSMAKHTTMVKCVNCGKMARQIISNPMVNIPENMRAVDSSYHGKKAKLPLNIIDEKPDGSYRVTRIGQKADIDNE